MMAIHAALREVRLAFVPFEMALRPLLGSLEAACRPTRVDCLHRVPDNHPLDMLALRTFERQKVGMGGTRFDPGQHHPALTPRAAGPLDGKQRRAGMTIGFWHDASPALGGSGTLSVTGRCRKRAVIDPHALPVRGAVVNIAHIGKVKRRRIAHSPHNAFRSSGTSPNFLISLCDEFNLRLER